MTTAAADLFRVVAPEGSLDRFVAFAERSAALVALSPASRAAREFRAARWAGLVEELFPESEIDTALVAELADGRHAELVAERASLVRTRASGQWRASDGRALDRLNRDITTLNQLRTVARSATV